MTEDEWNSLFDITKKAAINGRMGLTDEELGILRGARQKMRFHERMRLSYWSHTAAAMLWCDFGEVSQSRIEIDDRSSQEREQRPYARVSFSDGYHEKVETIDILESVKRNPASIGHPAIVFAVYHWQEVIQAERVIKRPDVHSQSDMGKALKRVFDGGQELESAQRNIEALTKAFLAGIKGRRISKEVAFAVKVNSMGLGETNDNLLREAWERLAAKHIDQKDEPDQRRNKIEAHLREIERNRPNMSTSISIATVMEFLASDGAHFVYCEASEKSQRPAWKVFMHAFLAFYFPQIDPTSVQEYLEEARRQGGPETVYQPSFNEPKARFLSVLNYVLATPLVTVDDLKDLDTDSPESN